MDGVERLPIPSQWEIALPFLRLLKDREVHEKSELVSQLSDEFNLSNEEREIRLKYGHTKISNRTGWAILNLRRAGLIRSRGRGKYEITERGEAVLDDSPDEIDNEYLMQYEEYREFIARSKGRTPDVEKEEEVNLPPDEKLVLAHTEHQEGLASELLDNIMDCSPQFFEHLVIDLLVAMGYGGSRRDAGEALGRVGDEGIDGIIKEDKLGLDSIFIQAKRWSNTVGRPIVQSFVGSLEGRRARKGILITTSVFSQEAKDYVGTIEKKVALVDGNELAKLMIEHNVGVSEVESYPLKRVDQDYFEV